MIFQAEVVQVSELNRLIANFISLNQIQLDFINHRDKINEAVLNLDFFNLVVLEVLLIGVFETVNLENDFVAGQTDTFEVVDQIYLQLVTPEGVQLLVHYLLLEVAEVPVVYVRLQGQLGDLLLVLS